MSELAFDLAHQNDEVYGSFHLGYAEFAIPATSIKDVINAPERFAPQPLSPEYVLGIMTLRDMTMPVIDLQLMFDLGSDAESHEKKVAIIEYGQLQVGLLFDRTGEVFRNTGALGEFYGDMSDNNTAITKGAFQFDNGKRIIQLLNTKAVIELNGPPLTSNDPEEEAVTLARRPPDRPIRQSISFRVNTIELAFHISEIQEIVLVDSVENAIMTNQLCMGTTNLRGVTIPLIDLARVLELPNVTSASEITQKKVIIYRTHGQLFGLVVDEICNLVRYFDDEVIEFPVISVTKPELFKGCIAHDTKQILQLDPDKLLSAEEVADTTKAYGGNSGTHDTSTLDKNKKGTGRIETFMTFEIDRIYAVSILDIIEVVDYPEELLEPPMLGGHFEGVLNLRGDLISVINARRLYNMQGEDHHCGHIIIFEYDATRYGLAIKTIESITKIFESQKHDLPKAMLDHQSTICADVKEVLFRENEEQGYVDDLLVLDISALAARIIA